MKKKRKIAVIIVIMALALTPVFNLFGEDSVQAGGELTGDCLAIAKLITGNSAQTTAISDVKQILSKFGVITFGNYKASCADAEGSIAVGGNLNVKTGITYSVGKEASCGVSALINGTIVGNGCNFNNNPVALGSDSTLAGAYSTKYIIGQNQVIDFTTLKTSVQTMGNAMAAKHTAGATISAGTIWGSTPALVVNYTGSDTDVYVTFSDADLQTMENTKKINFNVPAGARVILTYTGTNEVVMPKSAYFREALVNQDTSPEGIAGNKRVLYNFTNTASVKLDTLNTGTIMAPKAAGTSLTPAGGGHISGQFIFNSFEPESEVGGRSPFEFSSLQVVANGGVTPTVTTAKDPKATSTPNAVTSSQTTSSTSSKGTIVVVITEDDGKTPIPNAKVQVINKDSKVVTTARTDKKGKLTVKNLTPSKYKIKVVSVPKGYTVPKKTISISVVTNKTTTKKLQLTTSKVTSSAVTSSKNSKKVTKSKVSSKSTKSTNSKKSPTDENSVKTGDDFNGLIPIVGMSVSGIVMIIIGLLVHKKKKQCQIM
jgi:choice-of-anchor A domain-containing protein/LPXTG-motif cell wall-anchored protein